MTPEQALQLIEQVTGLLQLNREDHNKILAALEVLRGACKPTEQPESLTQA